MGAGVRNACVICTHGYICPGIAVFRMPRPASEPTYAAIASNGAVSANRAGDVFVFRDTTVKAKHELFTSAR